MGLFQSAARRRHRSDMDEDYSISDPVPVVSDADQSTEAEAREGAATGRDGSPGDSDDLATLLSYLIRSGQVRILQSPGRREENDFFMEDIDDEDDDDDYLDDDGDGRLDPDDSSKPTKDFKKIPDTKCIDENQLKQQILLESGQYCLNQKRKSVLPICNLLQQREVGLCRQKTFSQGDCCSVNSNYLPNHMRQVATYSQKAFCGTYSQDGDIFLSACQDRHIRIYDTTRGRFHNFKTVYARDVGWSVLDTAFSPDRNYLIYSSWSDCIHLCNIYGDHETHDALPLSPDMGHSFCVFSVCFSQDNLEILGGANDGCLYVYDRDKNERTLRIDAHDDDVNAVAFADNSSQILFSGSDDGLCKVWDRRTLREERPVPVGVHAGHSDGITYIDSKGDGRYLISNSKDQSIKLWDMRRFSSNEAQRATKQAVAKQNWDYRWQHVPGKVTRSAVTLPGDSCIMTYRGHRVLNTLLRSRFSPQHTTGQRYIYTGCASGRIIVYDVLTGKMEKRLAGHRSCVRDVSWHPYENKIISTSWDFTLGEWTYLSRTPDSEDDRSDADGDEDRTDDYFGRRRSPRLKARQGQRRGGGGTAAWV